MPLEEREDRVLLSWVECETQVRDIVEEATEKLVAPCLAAGQQLVEGTRHRPTIVGQVDRSWPRLIRRTI